SVPAPAADSPTVTARVGHTLTAAAAGLPLRIEDGRQSPDLGLPARYRADGPALTQIVSLPALPRHAALLTGSWPGGLTAGGTATAATAAAGPVPACLPGTAARRLHLRAGDMLRLRDVPDQITITVRITCTFARRQA